MRLLSILPAFLSLCGAAAADPPPAPALATAGQAVLAGIDGTPHPLAQHRGKVLIGVPSRDFGVVGGQEPGTETGIKAFCTTTQGITFPMMAKAAVKGDAAVDAALDAR